VIRVHGSILFAMQKPTKHLLHCLTLGASLLFLSGAFAQDAKAAAAKPTLQPPDPNAWSIKVYRYPSEALVNGFVLRERGQLAAPPMPAATATEEELLAFLRRSNDVVSQHLRFESVLLPKGSLVAFDPANQTLVIRTTYAMHERIGSLATGYQAQLARYLSFSVRLIEADGAVVRDIIKQNVSQSEHADSLAKLEDLVTKGQAKNIGVLRLDTRSGQRAKISQSADHAYATEYAIDEKNQASVVREVRPVGTIFEMDPVLGPDGLTIDVNLALEHHFAPPTKRYEQAGQRGKLSIETQVTDFHIAKVTTAITMMSGTTKFLGAWKPETSDSGAAPVADRMQAAFLKGDVVSVLPAYDKRLEDILRTHGEKVEPQPKGPPTEPSDLPPGMILRSFRVPPTFLSSSDSAAGGAAAAPADPFAPAAAPMLSEPRLSVRITALEILRAQGIPFPPGSSANFTPSTAELLVRNTPKNMELVEGYLSQLINTAPRVVVVTLQVVQADGATLRRLEAESATLADNTATFASLDAEIAAGRAKILRTGWLETRSGQRATFEVIDERNYVSGTEVSSGGRADVDTPKKQEGDGDQKPSVVSHINVSGSGLSMLAPSLETQAVGFRFELDPVIGPDGLTLDLNYALEYDFAPPELRKEALVADDKVLRIASDGTDFRRANLTTAITLHSGMTRLIGIWKPQGKPEFENGDVMQAAFLRAEIVGIDSGEVK
jgi:hypothetical protein